MPTIFPYSDRYEPPAPVLRTLISVPGSGSSSSSAEVIALCDTGADITCLPREVVVSLGLIEVDEISVAPYDGEPEVKPVYAALLRVDDSNSQIARVITANGPEAILGRDLLNSLQMELDGPSRMLRLL